MKQVVLPIPLPNELMSLPAKELLNQFGGGGHSPGSGSAAALMGLLSSQLIATVCKITVSDGNDSDQFSYVLGRLEKIIPGLQHLFQKDADDFDKVIQMRVMRDAATDPTIRRRYREQALRLLEESTDLIFQVSRTCLQLVDLALIVFDGGSKKVRGDSGAAISAALAGAMSGIFIINLNLRSFQAGRWAVGRQREAELLYEDILKKQEDAFKRIITLKPATVEDLQPTLFD